MPATLDRHAWPPNPIIYEINTWVWLWEIGQRLDRKVTLASVPDKEWDALAALRVDAIWLMGVWQRSPVGTHIARHEQSLQPEYRRALPDFILQDVVGSPYSIHRYEVDAHLGGEDGLAAAREMLAERDLRLVLDFVPNHVAPDHPWLLSHPEYFIRGDAGDLEEHPNSFIEANRQVFACGRDPYFPAWRDTVQLNAFSPGLRQAAVDTLTRIAGQCDGVRCDMAMLLINSVFERTWGWRAGDRPQTEYWRDVIPQVKAANPKFLFMAEAYWDLEWELQQQGFDYCYDKRIRDRLEHASAESIRLHLCAGLDYQSKLVRFIENHDEPRAAVTFDAQRNRAAAVTICSLPGAKLLHEGQFEGFRVKLPVQLGRRPLEEPDLSLQSFYRRLLKAVSSTAFREGEWCLCERSGWPDNGSYLNLVAWCWHKDDERHVIVVNLSGTRSQAHVWLPWRDLAGRKWRMLDPLTGDGFDRDGDDLARAGLFVNLDPWQFHFLSF